MTNQIDVTGPEVSIILGFKDWGVERLAITLPVMQSSLGTVNGEVLVVDYGSADPESVEKVVESAGARYQRVDTAGEWSRSRALNAGVAVAKGKYILATDADMLFSPGALETVTRSLNHDDRQVVILQCRDLPESYSVDTIGSNGIDWAAIESSGLVRPRWGMGGLVGISRAHLIRMRGWDERMHTYGGEDIDFARRAQRYGLKINWLDSPGAAMYHIWHESSHEAAKKSPAAIQAIENNHQILNNEKTFVRNLVDLDFLTVPLPPVVSVILIGDGWSISDPNALATVRSVLGQSLHDIEVIVPDEMKVLASVDDRIRSGSVELSTVDVKGLFIACVALGDIWEETRLTSLVTKDEDGTGIISEWICVGSVDSYDIAWDPLQPSSSLVRSTLLDGSRSAMYWQNWTAAAGASGAKWKSVQSSSVLIPAALTDPPTAGFGGGTLLTAAGVTLPVVDTPPNVGVQIPKRDARAFIEFSGVWAVPEVFNDHFIEFAETTEFTRTDISTLAGDTVWTSIVLTSADEEAIGRLIEWSQSMGLQICLTPSEQSVEVIPRLLDHAQLLQGGGREAWWMVAAVETKDEAEIIRSLLSDTPGINNVAAREVADTDQTTLAVLASTSDLDRDELLSVSWKLPAATNIYVARGSGNGN